MTQVDFYILESSSDQARLTIACRIADRAIEQRRHVLVYCVSQTEARQLDELLWTFSQGSFIPHRIVEGGAGEPPVEPVLISYDSHPGGERWDLMINLAGEVPEFFSRYERVAEVVDNNPARREKGRERYRFYRDRGYELKTHRI